MELTEKTPRSWRTWLPAAKFLLWVTLVLSIAVTGLIRVGTGEMPDPVSIRRQIDGLGSWAPLLFAGMLTFRPFLFLPSSIVMMGAGLAFGPGLGALVTTFGLMLGAFTTYLLTRFLGYEFVHQRGGRRLEKLSQDMGPGFVLIMNMIPIMPLTLPNYLAGLAGVPPLQFMAATFLGLLPRVFAWTTMGNMLVERNWFVILPASLLLLILMAIPLAFPSVRRYLRELKNASPEPVEELP